MIDILKLMIMGVSVFALTLKFYNPRPKDPRTEIYENIIADLPREQLWEILQGMDTYSLASRRIREMYFEKAEEYRESFDDPDWCAPYCEGIPLHEIEKLPRTEVKQEVIDWLTKEAENE